MKTTTCVRTFSLLFYKPILSIQFFKCNIDTSQISHDNVTLKMSTQLLVFFYLPDIYHTGAQTSISLVPPSFKTQWYAKPPSSEQLWFIPTALQSFLAAADFHSSALAGQRDTYDTVGIDCGHPLYPKL